MESKYKYIVVYTDHGETCDGKAQLLGEYVDYKTAKEAVYKDIYNWMRIHERDCEGEFDASFQKMCTWCEDSDCGCDWTIINLG